MKNVLFEMNEYNLKRIKGMREQDTKNEGKETNNIQFIIEGIRNGKLSGLPKDCGNENPIILAGHS